MAVNYGANIHKINYMQTINQRISCIIKHFCGDNKAEFARRVGERPQTVSNWMVRSITNRTVNKILNAFPEVNPSWLQFGEGEMLRDTEPEPSAPKSEALERLKEKVAAMGGIVNVATATKPDASMKGIIQRWETITPNANGKLMYKASMGEDTPEKGQLRAFVAKFNELAKVNPNKAIWLMTGEENGRFVDVTELMVKDNQIKGLRMVNESLEAENEMLRRKIKELTSISEQLAK